MAIEAATVVPLTVATASVWSMAKYGSIEWTGELGIATASWGFATIGAMIVSLKTANCYCWSKSEQPLESYGTYFTDLLGVSIGLKASFTTADVSVVTPAVLNPHPLALMGTVIWASGTIAYGTGRSYTLFTMGFGAAKMGLTPDVVSGIDTSLDYLLGVSMPITPFWGWRPCPN